MSNKKVTRHILELAMRPNLLEHPYRPPGLRFFETGDVIADASFEGEVNAMFRASGFSLLTEGKWVEYPWESVSKTLSPESRRMSETRLRIELKDERVVSFQMDHFGGYSGFFDDIAKWFEVSRTWRDVIERCECQRGHAPLIQC
jgi:hypothetical protein